MKVDEKRQAVEFFLYVEEHLLSYPFEGLYLCKRKK